MHYDAQIRVFATKQLVAVEKITGNVSTEIMKHGKLSRLKISTYINIQLLHHFHVLSYLDKSFFIGLPGLALVYTTLHFYLPSFTWSRGNLPLQCHLRW